jgi:hypothetical protein
MYLSMLYNSFYFYCTSLGRFFTLFPLRPLTVLSIYRSPVEYLIYWYRPHLSKNRLPVLFIHGISIRLYLFTNFLYDLKLVSRDDTEVGIIALEIIPVSSCITYTVLGKDVIVREIRAIVKHYS